MQYVSSSLLALNACLALCVGGGGSERERRLCIKQAIKSHAAAGHHVVFHDCCYGGWVWDVGSYGLRSLLQAQRCGRGGTWSATFEHQ